MGKILRRVIAIIPAALLQILWLLVILKELLPYAHAINLVLTLFAVIFVLYIISSRNESSYKTLWLLIILGLPVMGTVLYLLLGNKRTGKGLKKKIERVKLETDDSSCSDIIEEENLRFSQTVKYLENKTGFKAQPVENVRYYPLGEDMFGDMLYDLENAEEFIFAEYFIVEKGKMWNSMVEIMERKVKEGVRVYVMYDDLGSISTYSKVNFLELTSKGIKCIRFNPIVFIRGTVNYRDHRKMLVIDGKVAYSGGVNLADEYINEIVRFGHWKDIGFRVTGKPAGAFTCMFAQFWNAFSEEIIEIPDTYEGKCGDGYVLSYYDSPLNDEATSNTLYIDILSQAKAYAWFYTPYLLLGDSLLDAFCQAAKRGVDISIIMPGIPDKKMVFRMAKSYYRPLLDAGVKIYEYTPGFVHAKGMISDDIIGTVGTVNLDYRSLFLHFENNSLFYRSSIIDSFKEDFINTQNMSEEKTASMLGGGFFRWIMDGILRVFAPLC